MPERSSWEKTWLSVARCVQERSLCVRDKVGAVIIDVNNRIVATGYNGPPNGFNHQERPCTKWCPRAITSVAAYLGTPGELNPSYNDCPSLHAEANALMVCDRRDRECGTIYLTSHPCMSCAKLIANSGLETLVVKPMSLAAHREPQRVYDFLEKCGITVYVTG